jgi:DNA-binding HxlR family transcriptional regulator
MIADATAQAQLDAAAGSHSITFRTLPDHDRGGVNGDCHVPQVQDGSSIQFALTLIQGKWKIGILSYLQKNPARLSQLRKAIPQASKKMLVQHLREMERDGLITRTDMSGKFRRVEYSLTNPLGVATSRLLNALAQWVADYRPGHSIPEKVPRLFEK